ncbi:hypothetical protein CYMTET_28721 [Cymbomonas tetramitiformis]|uniref:Uncharacterized protein n=1 Tax=Cymbomonas tetramitiformis TaxID=36881 RepID=A0AAE0FMJ9_9CHLO|nr:hypothetical protein CYMTET_28721 [Cymbomonas tetramitiformis]
MMARVLGNKDDNTKTKSNKTKTKARRTKLEKKARWADLMDVEDEKAEENIPKEDTMEIEVSADTQEPSELSEPDETDGEGEMAGSDLDDEDIGDEQTGTESPEIEDIEDIVPDEVRKSLRKKDKKDPSVDKHREALAKTVTQLRESYPKGDAEKLKELVALVNSHKIKIVGNLTWTRAINALATFTTPAEN